MRQVAHEHPFFHPGRALHVREPGVPTFIRGGPEFIGPGLLGVAPVTHIPRPPPRHVRYPLHARQQELVRPPELMPLHPPLAENFFQMAWLKGIQRDKKMSHTRNHGSSNAAKLKNSSSKVAKKGVSLGNTQAKFSKEQANTEAKHKQEDAGTSKQMEVAFEEQSAAEEAPKEQHAKVSNEQLSSETKCMDEHRDAKTSIEDLEEGEIVNVDVDEDSKQIESPTAVSGEGDTSHLNSVLESVDNAECEIGFGSSGQIGIVVSEEDPQQLEKVVHTSEKEIANFVSNSVNIVEQKNLGISSVDMNDNLPNTSSAEVLVQNATNISAHVPHAKHDWQFADMDRDGNCLDNQISPPVQELSICTKLEPVEFEDSKVDARSSIEYFAKPEEERCVERKPSSSSMACEALVGMCSDSNLQRPIEACANERRENPVQTHSSSTILEAGPKPQEEPTASITKEQIFATLRCILSESTCLALADKVGAGATEAGNITQGLVPFLSEISGVLETFEKGNSCSKSRDPRRNLKTLHFEESESYPQHATLAKEITVEKRKRERQEDVPETPAKRLCTEEEIASQSKLDNQLHPEVLHQEPIDMEIDSSDSVAYVSVGTCLEATSESNANPQDDIFQTNQSGSEHSLVMDPAKLRLRSRDPRRALVDRGKAKIGFVCAGDTHSQPKTTPCVPEGESVLLQRKKGSNPSFVRLSEGVGSLENIHFEGLTDQQLKAVYVERARRIDEQNRMLNSKKLCLVLDLDHTLLNSAKFSEVDKFKLVLHEMEAADRRNIDNRSAKRGLYCYPKLGMWTKLRPGVWDFLSRASQLYELHVYTMGNKAYATEMAKLLDPTGTLFAGRVISRGDDNDRTFNSDVLPKSKDLDGVLGLESAVIIIDDSVQVWPHHRHNLLLVERYMYFPSSRRQFGLSGPSLLEIKHDERTADGMLASVLKVIEKIHHSFFTNQRLHEVDVRRILATEKRSVLAGCKIVFSRVYPQGASQPHLHPLWQTAEQFGAVCTTNIDDEVTHVVAISRGTDKVKWAMRTGRFSVCPAWLEASAVLYRRANESDFPVPL